MDNVRINKIQKLALKRKSINNLRRYCMTQRYLNNLSLMRKWFLENIDFSDTINGFAMSEHKQETSVCDTAPVIDVLQALLVGIILTDFSWFASVTPGECSDITLQLGHDRLLPHPFRLIIHLSTPFIQRCILWDTVKASLNNLRSLWNVVVSHIILCNRQRCGLLGHQLEAGQFVRLVL
jgi:hypothetical protein